MTSPALIPGLTLKERYPVWLETYSPEFWAPWHMSLQGHGHLPQERPVSSMDELYERVDTPAGRHLLSFEARTLLPRLPSSTAVTMTLLRELANEILDEESRPGDFWLRLESHYKKHIIDGDSRPYLMAAAHATVAFLRDKVRVPEATLSRFNPGTLRNPHEYGALACLLLLAALSAERPFGFFLYCPYTQDESDTRPTTGLVLNIRVPSPLMELGRLQPRDVLLGVTLASAREIQLGGGIYAPRLVQHQNFSTLFAPDERKSAAMLEGGRGSHLTVS